MLKILSIVGYLGMIGGLFGLVVTRTLFSSSPFVIAVQMAALLLFAWARVTFGRRSYHVTADPTEGGLVTWGPYRYIRHPIYTAFCVFTWAGVAVHWSWWPGVCGVVILGCALIRMYCEETLVAASYPGYAQYAAKTRRMIPYVF